MAALAVVGTGAMLWVGGSIILHGLDELGFGGPYHWIHDIAVAVGSAAPMASGFVEWLVTATFDGILGLLLGLALIPVATRVVGPLVARVTGRGDAAAATEGAH
jgi:predicted DNA repair protein MutK